MRIIHTSDWHIGRKFNERDLLGDQAAFGDWLVDVVRGEEIDAVLLSGDVFDRANPAADAVALTGSILERVVDAGAQVVMISGNHDSAERLGFVAALTARAGLHIVTERRSLADIDGLIDLTGHDGTTVQILAVPYLEPSRLLDVGEGIRTHEAAIADSLGHGRNRLIDPARTMVMAHAFVQGGMIQTTDSERTLTVGGTDRVDPKIFDGFGYVALGHLHRPQQAAEPNVVYSGSPLAYSFSEEHAKSVRLVTFDERGFTHEEIGVSAGRPVRTIEDTLERLLTRTEYATAESAWVRALLTDENLQIGAMDRLRLRFPHILAVTQSATLAPQQPVVVTDEHGRARPPTEIVDDYIVDTFGESIDDEVRSFITEGVNEALSQAVDA